MLIPTLIGDYLNLAHIVRFVRGKSGGSWMARTTSLELVQLAAWFDPDKLAVQHPARKAVRRVAR